MLGKSLALKERNLYEVYERFLNRNPTSVLIEPGRKPFTYDHLHDLVISICSRLRQLHVTKGDIVSVFVPNGVKRVACMLALMKLGIPFVPLDPLLPRVKVEHIFDRTQPKFVIVADEHNYRELWNEYDIHSVDRLYLSDFLISDDSSRMNDAYVNGVTEVESVELDDLFIILPTSGSTGVPKLVKLTHGNLLNRMYWSWDDFPFGIDEVTCSKASFIFLDWPVETLMCVLRNESCLFLQINDIIDTTKFVNYLSEYKVTRLVTVPSLLSSLTTFVRENNIETSLRHVTSASDMLTTKVVKDFLETFPSATLTNLFGATESGGDNMGKVFWSVDDLNVNEQYAPIGFPLHNNKVVLWDDNGNEIDELNVTGEIVLSGLGISQGYLGMPIDENETAIAKLPPVTLIEKYRMCRMNDFGYFTEKDGIMLVGRRDRVVKIRGQKVDLTEVERTLKNAFPEMDIFVTSKDMEPGGTKIYAFCAVGENATITRKDVVTAVKKKIQRYMVPRVILVSSLPLNPISGKIDRLKLSTMINSMGASAKDLSREQIQSLSKEDQVKLVVSSVIGVDLEAGDMDASFFEVGGDSGTMMPLVRGLKSYGIDADVPDIIMAKSLRELATRENV